MYIGPLPASQDSVEAGKGKPQKGTLVKLEKTMKSVESKPAAIEPAKKKRKVKAAAKAKPGPKTRKVKASVKPKRMGRSRRVAARARAKSRKAGIPLATGAGPIKLTNLDLELINRVLNMSEREKLELLGKLM